MKKTTVTLLLACFFVGLQASDTSSKHINKKSPRIINIINFIRQSEPRDKAITETVLYETVVQQIDLMSKYNFRGTFLLQYDALLNPDYQILLRKESTRGSEVGAWWEITQPHVEAAGLKWRGRYSWDWHADVGFATGYTPEEREKLVDVYMEKFKSIFGAYPVSVGSWFIDAHTLGYMYDKYHIIASCNCKDQLGTDGYTLWGGYWNQAYYPSRKNAYMPAQNASAQIPVPVFRMLGSDPIYQYDTGLGGRIQGVISLEPVYGDSGGDRTWVEWFLNAIVDGPCLAFNYAQAGQENSFTWAGMGKGLTMQMPILDSLQKADKITIETLRESGEWFKKKFSVTPPTAVTVMNDVRNEGRKTVWYNSRYYRVNLLWEGNSFRFRDIHLFNENLESDYLKKAGTSNQCVYMTLPVVDGFLWSTAEERAGLRFIRLDANGNGREILMQDQHVTELSDQILQVECLAQTGEMFRIIFHENRFEITCKNSAPDFSWALELTAAANAALPFQSFEKKQIKALSSHFEYTIRCKKGFVEKAAHDAPAVFRLIPQKNIIVVDGKLTS